MDGRNKTSYRSIFKATSLFGGIQIYQILIKVIKSKFIAILLGPSGVGIQSLYTTAIETIRCLTSLGLSQSAVRDISEANSSGDEFKINEIGHCHQCRRCFVRIVILFFERNY